MDDLQPANNACDVFSSNITDNDNFNIEACRFDQLKNNIKPLYLEDDIDENLTSRKHNSNYSSVNLGNFSNESPLTADSKINGLVDLTEYDNDSDDEDDSDDCIIIDATQEPTNKMSPYVGLPLNIQNNESMLNNFNNDRQDKSDESVYTKHNDIINAHNSSFGNMLPQEYSNVNFQPFIQNYGEQLNPFQNQPIYCQVNQSQIEPSLSSLIDISMGNQNYIYDDYGINMDIDPSNGTMLQSNEINLPSLPVNSFTQPETPIQYREIRPYSDNMNLTQLNHISNRPDPVYNFEKHTKFQQEMKRKRKRDVRLQKLKTNQDENSENGVKIDDVLIGLTWRTGPASYWYNVYNVPADENILRYRIKPAFESDNESILPIIKAESLTDDDCVLSTWQLVNWEEDIITDMEASQDKIIESNNKYACHAGWIPSAKHRDMASFQDDMFNDYFGIWPASSTGTMIQRPNVTQWHSIFAIENAQLFENEWVSKIIIDPRHKNAQEPYLLELDLNNECIHFDFTNPLQTKEILTSELNKVYLTKSSTPAEVPVDVTAGADSNDAVIVPPTTEDIHFHETQMKKMKILHKITKVTGFEDRGKEQPLDPEDNDSLCMLRYSERDPYTVAREHIPKMPFFLEITDNDNDRGGRGIDGMNPLIEHGIQHSHPATQLDPTFFPLTLDNQFLRHMHRTRLSDIQKPMVPLFTTPQPIYNLIDVVQSESEQRQKICQLTGSGDLFFMRSIGDLSASTDHLVLAEYSEEYPPLMMQTGMASRIINYFKGHYNQPVIMPELPYGDLCVLPKIPFLGHLSSNQIFQTIENNMFRAPIYSHKLKPTDFLVIIRQNTICIRRVTDIFVVGQELPLMEVPAPNSKKANTFLKDFFQVQIIRLFLQSTHNPKRIRHDEIKAMFSEQSDSTLKKRLRIFAEYKKAEPGSNGSYWALKPQFQLPTEDELLELISPEECCSYYSMVWGLCRLEDAGYNCKSFMQADPDQQDDDEVAGKESHLKLEDEVKAAPWHTTRTFLDSQKKKCYLELYGSTDPTGCGESFSYARVSARGSLFRETVKIQTSGPFDSEAVAGARKRLTGTDADLRKLTTKKAISLLKEFGISQRDIKKLKRWDIIDLVRQMSTQRASRGEEKSIIKFARTTKMTTEEQEQRYKKECQRIFNLQNQVLANDDELTTDEGESDEEEEDDRELADEAENYARLKKSMYGSLGKRLGVQGTDLESDLFRPSQALATMVDHVPGKKFSCPATADNARNILKGKPPVPKSTPKAICIRRQVVCKDGTKTVLSQTIPWSTIVKIYFKMNEEHKSEYLRNFCGLNKNEDEKKARLKQQEKLKLLKQKKTHQIHYLGQSSIMDSINNIVKLKKYRPNIVNGKIQVAESLINVKCGACGTKGHMRTSKTCPLYMTSIKKAIQKWPKHRPLGKPEKSSLQSMRNPIVPYPVPPAQASSLAKSENSLENSGPLTMRNPIVPYPATAQPSQLPAAPVLLLPNNIVMQVQEPAVGLEFPQTSYIAYDNAIINRPPDPIIVKDLLICNNLNNQSHDQVTANNHLFYSNNPCISQPLNQFVGNDLLIDNVIISSQPTDKFMLQTNRISDQTVVNSKISPPSNPITISNHIIYNTSSISLPSDQINAPAPYSLNNISTCQLIDNTRLQNSIPNQIVSNNLEQDPISHEDTSVWTLSDNQVKPISEFKLIVPKDFDSQISVPCILPTQSQELNGNTVDLTVHAVRRNHSMIDTKRQTRNSNTLLSNIKHTESLSDQKNRGRRRIDPRIGLNHQFEEIYKGLLQIPGYRCFLHPVRKKEFPSYDKIVEKPMDLTKVKMKINKNGYETREDFIKDIKLIYDNCIKFNGNSNEFTTTARQMISYVMEQFCVKERKLMRLEKQANPLMDDDDMVGLRYILDKTVSAMAEIEYSLAFHAPVNKKKYPDYYAKISQPMDLQTLRGYVNDDKYKTREEFMVDANQILTNCIIYNSEDAPITNVCRKMMDAARKFFTEHDTTFTTLETNLRMQSDDASGSQIGRSSCITTDQLSHFGEENTEEPSFDIDGLSCKRQRLSESFEEEKSVPVNRQRTMIDLELTDSEDDDKSTAHLNHIVPSCHLNELPEDTDEPSCKKQRLMESNEKEKALDHNKKCTVIDLELTESEDDEEPQERNEKKIDNNILSVTVEDSIAHDVEASGGIKRDEENIILPLHSNETNRKRLMSALELTDSEDDSAVISSQLLESNIKVQSNHSTDNDVVSLNEEENVDPNSKPISFDKHPPNNQQHVTIDTVQLTCDAFPDLVVSSKQKETYNENEKKNSLIEPNRTVVGIDLELTDSENDDEECNNDLDSIEHDTVSKNDPKGPYNVCYAELGDMPPNNEIDDIINAVINDACNLDRKRLHGALDLNTTETKYQTTEPQIDDIINAVINDACNLDRKQRHGTLDTETKYQTMEPLINDNRVKENSQNTDLQSEKEIAQSNDAQENVTNLTERDMTLNANRNSFSNDVTYCSDHNEREVNHKSYNDEIIVIMNSEDESNHDLLSNDVTYCNDHNEKAVNHKSYNDEIIVIINSEDESNHEIEHLSYEKETNRMLTDHKEEPSDYIKVYSVKRKRTSSCCDDDDKRVSFVDQNIDPDYGQTISDSTNLDAGAPAIKKQKLNELCKEENVERVWMINPKVSNNEKVTIDLNLTDSEDEHISNQITQDNYPNITSDLTSINQFAQSNHLSSENLSLVGENYTKETQWNIYAPFITRHKLSGSLLEDSECQVPVIDDPEKITIDLRLTDSEDDSQENINIFTSIQRRIDSANNLRIHSDSHSSPSQFTNDNHTGDYCADDSSWELYVPSKREILNESIKGEESGPIPITRSVDANQGPITIDLRLSDSDDDVDPTSHNNSGAQHDFNIMTNMTRDFTVSESRDDDNVGTTSTLVSSNHNEETIDLRLTDSEDDNSRIETDDSSNTEFAVYQSSLLESENTDYPSADADVPFCDRLSELRSKIQTMPNYQNKEIITIDLNMTDSKDDSRILKCSPQNIVDTVYNRSEVGMTHEQLNDKSFNYFQSFVNNSSQESSANVVFYISDDD